MILALVGFTAAQGQYFLQFTTSRDGKAAADVSVHLSRLVPGKAPLYAFYITDNTGHIQVKDSGSYLLQVVHVGYKKIQDTIYLNHGKSHPYKVRLEELEYMLNEAVVTGEFEVVTTDQSLNKVRVIDRKRIERQGAVNMKDLLSNELNIRLINDPALGTGMSLMGISGQNVKILVDGVPLIGRNDGTIDLGQINLANVERVEIIEGPMSVLYGTDALGGVINIITKKAPAHRFESGIGTYYESSGHYNIDTRMAVKSKKGFSAQWTAGRNFFDGYQSPGEVRSSSWRPKEQYFSDFMMGMKKGNSTHRFQSAIFHEKLISKAEPVFTPYSIYARDQYFYTLRINPAVYSDFRISPKTTYSQVASYSYFRRIKNTYRKDLVNLTEQLTAAEDDQDTSVFDLFLLRGIFTHKHSKHWTWQTGYEVNLESGKGERLVGRNTQEDYAAFIITEWKPGVRWSIKPGARFIHNTRFGSPSFEMEFGRRKPYTIKLPVIPSFNVKYNFRENLALRLSFAKGYRAPGLKELYLFFVDVNHNVQGNADLRPENSSNLQSSLSWFGRKGSWAFKADAGAFYNEMSDMISLALVNSQTNLYQYINIDRFKTQGIQVNGEVKKGPLQVQLGYSITGRYNRYRVINSSVFSYSPEYRVQATYTIQRWNSDVSLFYKMTGAQPGFSINEQSQVSETRIGSYQMLDLTISNNCWKRRITIVGGVKNLLNVTQVNINGAAQGGSAHGGGGGSIPVGMGRTFFVNLKLNLVSSK